MERDEYMEEISNKIRSGEPVGFLEKRPDDIEKFREKLRPNA